MQMKYAEALAEIARQRQEDPHEMNHADDALVVNATALIAELERSYELIDKLKGDFPWDVTKISNLLESLNAQDICCTCGYQSCQCAS